MRNKKKGYTLIEILVVMLIVSVLSAIFFVSFQGAQKASRDGRRKADLEQIRSALEMYRNDVKQYPANLGLLVSTYISAIPTDPGNYSYVYSSATPSTYVLCSYLETGRTAVTGCTGCNGAGNTCYYIVTNP